MNRSEPFGQSSWPVGTIPKRRRCPHLGNRQSHLAEATGLGPGTSPFRPCLVSCTSDRPTSPIRPRAFCPLCQERSAEPGSSSRGGEAHGNQRSPAATPCWGQSHKPRHRRGYRPTRLHSCQTDPPRRCKPSTSCLNRAATQLNAVVSASMVMAVSGVGPSGDPRCVLNRGGTQLNAEARTGRVRTVAGRPGRQLPRPTMAGRGRATRDCGGPPSPLQMRPRALASRVDTSPGWRTGRGSGSAHQKRTTTARSNADARETGTRDA
jgi:hypothetical protein